MRQGCPLTIYVLHCTLACRHFNKLRKKNKRNTDYKGKRKIVKIYVYADSMSVLVENVKCSTKNLIELIIEFSKVTGDTVTTKKSNVCL